MAKKGVALYKEIKATGGEVKDVLLDLKNQFSKIVNPSNEQKKQYNEQVKRVQEVAQANPAQVLNDVWDNLGTFVDQYDILAKAYVASEVSAKTVYKGDQSLGRRALERLKLRHQLDSMLAEVREQMVYNAPSELGDLWTQFEKMWMQIVAEQDEALKIELQQAQIAQWRRRKAVEEVKAKAAWAAAVFIVLLWAVGLMMLIRKSMTTYLGLYS